MKRNLILFLTLAVSMGLFSQSLTVDSRTGLSYRRDEVAKTRAYYTDPVVRTAEKGQPVWQFFIFEKEGSTEKPRLIFNFKRTSDGRQTLLPVRVSFFGDGEVEVIETPFKSLKNGFTGGESALLALDRAQAQRLRTLSTAKRVYFRLTAAGGEYENSAEFTPSDKDYMRAIISAYLEKF